MNRQSVLFLTVLSLCVFACADVRESEEIVKQIRVEMAGLEVDLEQCERGGNRLVSLTKAQELWSQYHIRELQELSGKLATLSLPECDTDSSDGIDDQWQGISHTVMAERLSCVKEALVSWRDAIGRISGEVAICGDDREKLQEMVRQTLVTVERGAADLERAQTAIQTKNQELSQCRHELTSRASELSTVTRQYNDAASVVQQVGYGFLALGTRKAIRRDAYLAQDRPSRKFLGNPNTMANRVSILSRELRLGRSDSPPIIRTVHRQYSHLFHFTDRGGVYVLVLDNPREFWSLSRYLVVEVDV